MRDETTAGGEQSIEVIFNEDCESFVNRYERDASIAGLLQAVGASGCHFMRGGSAYSSAQAQEHLSKKYEYMAARDMLVSTEDFIDKAATRSSMSGEPYAIRCGEAAAQKSADWMRARLKAMRQPAPR